MSSWPLAGLCRQSKACKKQCSKASQDADHSLKPDDAVEPAHQTCNGVPVPPTPHKGTLIAMPFEEGYIHPRNIPLKSSQAGMGHLGRRLRHTDTARSPSPPFSPGPVTGSGDDDWGLNLPAIEEYEATLKKEEHRQQYKACYHRKKQSQHRRWLEDIIPSLISLYQCWL
ncbi:hypothetical protein M422DRAFT_49371 [Sphaerobolus stellatus SS14]|uniref:Unplaced genomic scaffold SPHSTscaffold_72, whole genome shotgun sequence n=1 Tax=Sphaerobolus stellatus (strain SS14) TaxID=990650 RepID=A0A0C9VQB7_SPHS4|nr:hypothetical protein M422DRAFT_49371 [Sphaerobolus stellatus SS14]